MTVNINGDSSCGINVAHLGGRSREETAALRGSDEEEIEEDRERERGGRDGGGVFDLTLNKPLPSVSLHIVFQHLAEAIDSTTFLSLTHLHI